MVLGLSRYYDLENLNLRPALRKPDINRIPDRALYASPSGSLRLPSGSGFVRRAVSRRAECTDGLGSTRFEHGVMDL